MQENFRISQITKPIAKGATGVGKDIAKTATKLPGTLKDKVLGPVWNWIKKFFASFKFLISCACCLCCISCLVSFGVPQLLFSLLSGGVGRQLSSASPAVNVSDLTPSPPSPAGNTDLPTNLASDVQITQASKSIF